jgi:hypothetical protein
VSQGTFNFAMDCFHGFFKLSIIILFVIPWLAMKIAGKCACQNVP